MWWSQRIGGYNVLDYLVKVKDGSFVEVVGTLIGKAAVMPTVTVKPKQKTEPKILLLPDKSASTERITEYLFGRGIDYAMQSFPRLVTKRSGSRFIRPTPRCSCARMPTTSGRQESINRKNSTATQGAAEREPFDQSGAWGKYPPTSTGRFPASGNLPVRQVCINAGIACQV